MIKSHLSLVALRTKSFFEDTSDTFFFKRGNWSKDWRTYYWSLFVGLACDYDCSYCVQGFGFLRGRRDLAKQRPASPEEFLKLNRLEEVLEEPIPRLVITGGEPLLYPGLLTFMEKIRIFKKISIVSNLNKAVGSFIELGKKRKEVAITFIGSYHPEYAELDAFLEKAKALKENGMLEYCDIIDLNYWPSIRLLDAFKRAGIKAIAYRFVGKKNGKIYPRSMNDSCNGEKVKTAQCFMAAVLIAPDGKVYNCHAKLYRGKDYICKVDDFYEKFQTGYLTCHEYGLCHPCQANLVRIKDIH